MLSGNFLHLLLLSGNSFLLSFLSGLSLLLPPLCFTFCLPSFFDGLSFQTVIFGFGDFLIVRAMTAWSP